MFYRICIFLIFISTSALFCDIDANDTIKEIKAFNRSGQTFLTWKENGSKWYYIYSSNAKITDVKKLKWVAKIPNNSNHFRFTHLNKKIEKVFKGRSYLNKIQIEESDDASKLLSDETGLFVSTNKKDSTTYYAVTSTEGGQVTSGANSLKAPIKEKVMLPGANLVFREKNLNFYVFFTDFSIWNKDGIDDHIHGYAHVFTASIPNLKETKTLPLCVKLHAFSAWKDQFHKYSFPIKDGVTIGMWDYSLTWWFGLHEELKTLNKIKEAPKKGKVINYTEQRLMQVVNWIRSNPKQFQVKIDPARIYVFGGSMGGSGTNHITIKNGDVFAAGHASKGYTNWSVNDKFNPKINRFQNDFKKKYGSISSNLETNLNGRKVYDILNLASWVSDPKINMGYLETANGTVDMIIPFWGLATFWDALEKGKHPYSAGWDMVGHASRLGSGSKMVYHKLKINESIPALANASCNSKLKFGYRFFGSVKEIKKDRIILHKPIKNKIEGMTLVLGPTRTNKTYFKVSKVNGNEIVVESGDLVAFQAPVSNYQKSQLKKKLKREITTADLTTLSNKNKMKYLIIDGDPKGTRNGHIQWSCSLMNFDSSTKIDDIEDTPKRWGMNFRLTKNSLVSDCKDDTATVDITPRRCQQFKLAAGQKVNWENWDHSDKKNPVKVAEGEIEVDKYGLATVPKFKIGKKGLGNRLVLNLK
ncbi:MAG: hypothetical protein COA79_17300 [Planctomycetota bacterium]|nr:MAG: hypothetical protein COA79_17300 [Planctomycetota bacterium]